MRAAGWLATALALPMLLWAVVLIIGLIPSIPGVRP